MPLRGFSEQPRTSVRRMPLPPPTHQPWSPHRLTELAKKLPKGKRQAEIDKCFQELGIRRMSDTFRLSGAAARQLAGARQCDGDKNWPAVNCNFRARALRNAVMDNRNIIERPALKLITLDGEVRSRWCAQTRCRTGRRAPPARESRSARPAAPAAGGVRRAGRRRARKQLAPDRRDEAEGGGPYQHRAG